MTGLRASGPTAAALLLLTVLPGCGTAADGPAEPPPSHRLETVQTPGKVAGEAARTVVVGPDVTQGSEDPSPANLREDLWTLRAACASQIGQVRSMTWTLFTGPDVGTGQLATGTVTCDGEEHAARLPRLPGSGVQVSLSSVWSAYAIVVPRP